jgi:Na+/proline symporter
MCLAEVTVNFLFSVEDLSALLAHVLASSGLWGTSTFGYLTQLHLTPQYQEKRKKLHKLMCAAMITTHLFFFVFFALFDEFAS